MIHQQDFQFYSSIAICGAEGECIAFQCCNRPALRGAISGKGDTKNRSGKTVTRSLETRIGRLLGKEHDFVGKIKRTKKLTLISKPLGRFTEATHHRHVDVAIFVNRTFMESILREEGKTAALIRLGNNPTILFFCNPEFQPIIGIGLDHEN